VHWEEEKFNSANDRRVTENAEERKGRVRAASGNNMKTGSFWWNFEAGFENEEISSHWSMEVIR